MRLGRPAVVLQRTEKGIRREYVSGHGGDITLTRWRYANQVIPLRGECPGTVADVIGITSDLIVRKDRVLKVKRGAQLGPDYNTPPPIPLPFDSASARLFAIVLLNEFTVPISLKMPPPSVRATFPLTVLLVSVSVPAKLSTPPPPRLLGLEFRPARLFAIVLLTTFAVPKLLMPPPSSPESFPMTVLLVSVNVLPATL